MCGIENTTPINIELEKNVCRMGSLIFLFYGESKKRVS